MTTTLQAYCIDEAIAIVRELMVGKLYPDAVIDAWEANDGYDVLVWAAEADSLNDDGAKAIARYTIAAA